MAQIEISLPALGEGVIEAEITRWLVGEGEKVEAEQPVVEIATDKVDSEVPAADAGILVKILIGEGETAKIGQVLGILETDAGTYAAPAAADHSAINTEDTDVLTGNRISAIVSESTVQDYTPPQPSRTHFLSPAVRNLIKEHRISDADISNIQGTGENGRIIIADVRAFLATGGAGTAAREPDKAVPLIPEELIYGGPENEIIEMDRMRRIIARHMSYSKQVSPHVNSFIETDVTDLVYLRNSIKDRYLENHGQKLTLTPMILTAVIRAIKDFPLINVSVDRERIILKKSINIGMATALRNGNLIVPVIKDADKLSFKALVSRVNDLADRSRENQLRPDEIRGGTFTVTNLGPFGSLSGTPIIHQPEAAILALGAIKKKPAVVETEGREAIGIRHIMIMCLAYDHRVIDGALGGMFLKRISDILEKEVPETGF